MYKTKIYKKKTAYLGRIGQGLLKKTGNGQIDMPLKFKGAIF